MLQAILSDPTQRDQVARTTGMPIHSVLSTISVLEIRRLIRRVSGQQVMRV